MTPKILLRGLLLIASLAALGFLFKTTALGDFLDKAWIDSEVRGKGLAGSILFVAVGAAFTGVGLPRQVLSFLGGYAFGFMTGTALALLSTVVGCFGAFYYARFLGRQPVLARFPRRIGKIDNFLRESPLSMTLLIRLLPVGSNLIVNLGAGVSGIGAVSFLAGSAIGYLPQTVVFTLLGSGINVEPSFRISLSVVLFVVSAVMGVSLYRKYRHGKSIDEELDQPLADPGSDAPTAPTSRDPQG